jgi:hypothetical protein
LKRPKRQKFRRAGDDEPELPFGKHRDGTTVIWAATAAPAADDAAELAETRGDGGAGGPVFMPGTRRMLGRMWNFIVGVSLLPFCWIFTQALFNAFAHAKVRLRDVPFWKTHEFMMFASGALLWLVWFGLSVWIWRQPRPLRLYVWGHELMHAVVAKCFGGHIKEFEVSRDGGYIVTNRYNFLIALAPYLWPFAVIPAMAVWGIVGWIPGAQYHREVFLAAIGFTWMFHLSFTAWMIPIGQTDFHGPGHVFSLALIYIVNLVLITAVLIALAPEVSFRSYGRELSASFVGFYETALTAMPRAAAWISRYAN